MREKCRSEGGKNLLEGIFVLAVGTGDVLDDLPVLHVLHDLAGLTLEDGSEGLQLQEVGVGVGLVVAVVVGIGKGGIIGGLLDEKIAVEEVGAETGLVLQTELEGTVSLGALAQGGKAVSKETKIDILVTPFVTIFSGCMLATWCAPAIGAAASSVGRLIMWATDLQPFFMGILVSVLVGVALTLPISSAAICAALGLTGLAGGAAVAGCCAQMVGFAVMSFPENKWGGLVSQGLGTSMLQMGNIVRNPRIWIPPTLASAITGPIATCLFKLQMNGAPVSSGMGTCGLVGQIGVYTGWLAPSEQALANGAAAIVPTAFDWIGLILICFVLPAVLSTLFCIVLRRIGWIGEGDLTLEQ